MNADKWIDKNAPSLEGKVVAITGATGGLGCVLCRYFAKLNAKIIMLNRSLEKSLALKNNLLAEFPSAEVEIIKLDLGVFQDVLDVCSLLSNKQIDFLFINAGIYNVPLTTGATGYNNIFQVNFVSPYYLVKNLLPTLRKYNAKVIAVGSIAHKYSQLNINDVDFSRAKKASKIYGNSKRFLMFSLYELFQNEQSASLSVAHPGVTLTNMTNHYPKAINWLVKIGVKLLFPSPQKATLSLVAAMYDNCNYFEWIGPSRCNIWGKPKKTKLKIRNATESEQIFGIAEKIYDDLNNSAK